jgi:hypothetical protein
MMTITRVGPLSCAKVAGLLYVIVGLVAGAFISLAAMAGGLASNDEVGSTFGALFGVGAIILIPIFYGCLGFVMTLIGAALFNLAAGMVGGIEVDAR